MRLPGGFLSLWHWVRYHDGSDCVETATKTSEGTLRILFNTLLSRGVRIPLDL